MRSTSRIPETIYFIPNPWKNTIKEETSIFESFLQNSVDVL